MLPEAVESIAFVTPVAPARDFFPAWSRRCMTSRSFTPPISEPTITAVRSGTRASGVRPPCSMAACAACEAYIAEADMLRRARGSSLDGSKPLTGA